jgi:hypothetical protein
MTAASVVLQQAAPAASTPTDLYTVPADRRASVRIYVTEFGGAAASYTVRVRKAGAVAADAQLLASVDPLAANTNETVPVAGYPVLLSATDVVTVEWSTGTTGEVAFLLNGYEDDIPT